MLLLRIVGRRSEDDLNQTVSIDEKPYCGREANSFCRRLAFLVFLEVVSFENQRHSRALTQKKRRTVARMIMAKMPPAAKYAIFEFCSFIS